jgi:hypothetical protein
MTRLKVTRLPGCSAAGLDAILRGWLQAGLCDADLERHGIALFEGLYLTLRQQAAAASRIDP